MFTNYKFVYFLLIFIAIVMAMVVEEGMKRRDTRLHVGSTTTSEEETSLMDLELGFRVIF